MVDYIKSHEKLHHLPIIILSADAMPETIARLKNKGINEYMTKPLNIAVFNKTVLSLTQENGIKND